MLGLLICLCHVLRSRAYAYVHCFPPSFTSLSNLTGAAAISDFQCLDSHSLISSDIAKSSQAARWAPSMNYQQGLPDLTNSGLTPSQKFLLVTELGCLPNSCILAVMKPSVSHQGRKNSVEILKKKKNLFTFVCNHMVLKPTYARFFTSVLQETD